MKESNDNKSLYGLILMDGMAHTGEARSVMGNAVTLGKMPFVETLAVYPRRPSSLPEIEPPKKAPPLPQQFPITLAVRL